MNVIKRNQKLNYLRHLQNIPSSLQILAVFLLLSGISYDSILFIRDSHKVTAIEEVTHGGRGGGGGGGPFGRRWW